MSIARTGMFFKFIFPLFTNSPPCAILIKDYYMTQENQMKKYTVTEWYEHSPAAYVANGFIGFRFKKDPFHDVIAMLSGFTGVRQHTEVESPSLVPAPQIEFRYNGETVLPETVRQTYDFSNGEFETELTLDCGGEGVGLKYTVFCSRTSPTLLVSTLEFETETPKELEMDVQYLIPEKWRYTVSKTEYIGHGGDLDWKAKFWSTDGSTTAGAGFKLFGKAQAIDFSKTGMTCKLNIENGASYHFFTSYVPGVMNGEPENQAQRMVKLARWNGLERMRELNRNAWGKLWESRITIEGAAEEWQETIDASYFYLMSSASEFSPASVAPFGLSHPDAYEGHTFWDTESFIFMTPLFCAPDIARQMLDYRFKRMPAAEANARLNGYRGIQFPWQSGNGGYEVTVPGAGQAGGAGEQHVNLDVALAFDGFARVSGDEGFIREKVWPILRGVSEWITSRVEKTDRGYEILHVTGIDEESDNVPNDAYTNIMSVKILRSAAQYSEMLGFGKREKWIEIADKMYIPIREDGLLLQYEGMEEKKYHASTVLMSYFPYGFTNGEDSDRTTFEYYIRHGMNRYLCYPMLSGFLGLFPAWNHDPHTALNFYENANLTFFAEPFHAATEWSIPNPDDRKNPSCELNTSFITGRGSLLSGLIMGLTKVCPWKGNVDADISEWLGKEILLPEGWKSITVGKVYIRGKAYRIHAENGADHAEITEIEE